MNPQLIFDEIRAEWVAATPEEIVRQRLLKRMVLELGFPKNFLAIEKEIKQMPHVNPHDPHLPNRRADIICFAEGIHPDFSLYPLLLIECKQQRLDEKAANQLIGYNHYIKACFIALANGETVNLGYYDKAKRAYAFIPALPSYRELLNLVGHAGN